MSKSLLDLMTPEEREKALQRAAKRNENKKSKNVAISPEMFLVGEMGYYFAWDAILAIRRGYTVVPKTDEDLMADRKARKDPQWTSKFKREVFTLEEAEVLVEAAKKVWFSKVVDHAHSTMIGNSFKTESGSFNSAVQPYTDRTKLD